MAVNWPRTLTVPRAPDFVIGDNYLRRWWVIPRNRWFNIYLHNFRRSDDDRALHDHMYWNISVLLHGSYAEHLSDGRRLVRKSWRPWAPWRLVVRRPETAHRVELHREGDSVWSLFLTGPRLREWGFWCDEGRRWVHWRQFTDARDTGAIGRGCAE